MNLLKKIFRQSTESKATVSQQASAPQIQEDKVITPTPSRVEFDKFITLKDDMIFAYAKKHAHEGFFEGLSESEQKAKLLKTIKETYYKLSDSEIASDNNRLVLKTGIPDKEGACLKLLCVKDKDNKTIWYCEKLVAPIKDDLFDDWNDLKSDIVALCGDTTTPAQDIHNTVNANKDKSIYINRDGATLNNPIYLSSRCIDTGFTFTDTKENKEKTVYALFSYRKGIRGTGWYYQHLIYENPSLELFPKKLWLQKWASFDNFFDAIGNLASKTLPEHWSLGTKKDSILFNYLNYTFCRLYNNYISGNTSAAFNNQICFSGNYAAFNTGLPDKEYKEIYALFKKVDSAKNECSPLHLPHQYKFIAFIDSDTGKTYGDGKIFNEHFSSNLPSRPVYFSKHEDTFLQPPINPTTEINFKHIIKERFDRLPLSFFKIYWNNGAIRKMLDNDEISVKDKRQQIYDYIKDHDELSASAELGKDFQSLKDRLKQFTENALRNVRWNWRSAIPCYYPEDNTLSWLIPVRFDDNDDKPIALVVERRIRDDGEIYYQINTILTHEMAYNNARLICRPESDWLAPELIQPDEDETDSSDDE
ncbi:MAG: DUF3825 domain-containing protein [Clostridia bacterium]|nr:DUF3825 domain-containing protein [Clostridia bacterium]